MFPTQLPEQDLARTGEGAQAFNLQVQNSSLILWVQNLSLQRKFFLLCSCGCISVLPSGSLLLCHTCETHRPRRATSAAEQGSAVGGREARGAATAVGSLWGFWPSTAPNSGL